MSLGTSNRDGGKTSESGHLRALAKLVTGDVLSGLVVAQRAAGANMSVDISIGDAFLRRSDGSYAHPVFNDAVYNQVISTADGANPRRDIIVLYLDYSVAPITTVSNNTNGVVQIKIVNGTPAGAPVDPTDVAIQASVGAGNPWTKLARTRVPAAQTSISNTLIDDLRVMTTTNADTIDGIHASATPVANQLLPLNAAGLFPSSLLSFGASNVITGTGATTQSTASNTFIDVPLMSQPTIIVPSSGKVMVIGMVFQQALTTIVEDIRMRVLIGATASPNIVYRPVAQYNGSSCAVFQVMTGLTPGSYTAKLQFSVTSGGSNQTYPLQNQIIIIPIGS